MHRAAGEVQPRCIFDAPYGFRACDAVSCKARNALTQRTANPCTPLVRSRPSTHGAPSNLRLNTPRPGNFKPRYASTQDFIAIVNRVTGKDYGWFFDVYLRSIALPALHASRSGNILQLCWVTEGDKPFPMPVQVRVGPRVVEVPMTGGQGQVAIASDESYTLDPHSKVLRDLPYMADYQKDLAERAKAMARKP